MQSHRPTPLPLSSRQSSFMTKHESRSGSRPGTGRTSAAQSKEKGVKLGNLQRKQGFLQFVLLKQKLLEGRKDVGNKERQRGAFEFEGIIGKGGFGRVWRVRHKRSRRMFAMKEMSKALIISKRSVPSVMGQKQLLQSLRHPFLVNMHFAFQDRENLYLALDFLTNGDLRTQLGRFRRFSEDATRFFICCILEALEYLHSKQIIHRDIKPQNLIFDQKGYLRLTDLGVARKILPDNANDTSGTPGYMAPEVIFRQNHSYSVDFFATGVIAYECMLGRRPYQGFSRKEIRDKMVGQEAQARRKELPPGWSQDALDFVNRLLLRKPGLRLGAKGIAEVKSHPWLKDFPWDKLKSKSLRSPFNPVFRQEDVDQGEVTVEDDVAELVRQNSLLLREEQVQALFRGYEFPSCQ